MVWQETRESCLVSVGSWGGLMPCCLGGHTCCWKNLQHCFKGVMLTGLGALHRGPGYDDGAQWQCPGFWKHRAGRFMGPAGPGLFSLFCLGLPLFPGKAPLAFSNYCDRKMKGLHDPAALSAHPLSL